MNLNWKMKMILVITGPTGVGKTKLSIELAKKFNGEIINADSTQIFKNLDIATAKIKDSEKENIPHHLFDIKDIKENYTVYDYQRDSRIIIDDILSRNKNVIMVGGTGLYIKASLYDYKFEEEDIHFDYSNYSDLELYNLLKSIDPNNNIHSHNRRRIERALTYYKIHNKPISSVNKTQNLMYDNILFIGLTTKRDVLYERINNRVDKMAYEGLIDEARKIYDTNIRTKAVLTPIGYKELFEYFDNNCSLDDAINLIKLRSRRYAKRQYTFFNNQMNIKWFNVDFNDFNKTIDEVSSYVRKNI